MILRQIGDALIEATCCQRQPIVCRSLCHTIPASILMEWFFMS